jgi:hypothetical protein
MKSHYFITVLAFLTLFCKEPVHGKATPEDAFARLAPCVNEKNEICLFQELDRDSRWSLHSIFKLLKEADHIMQTSYPKNGNAKEAALGPWKEESKAKSAKEMFAIFCKKQRCMDRLTEGFGAILKVSKKSENEVTITTTRKKKFNLWKSADGKWGLSTYKEKLEEQKIRLGDVLSQIKINAAQYAQQQKATGNNI